jgi:glutamate synthase (NADPH/NADH) small chain
MRTPIRELDAGERVKNFEEVNCGYTEQEAMLESERCLFCPDPKCIAGCPVNINIPAFIQKIGEKDFHGADEVITDTNLLPAVCGRVCPQETQCEGV